MRTLLRYLSSFVLGVALLLSIGCAEQHGYRVYDPYYHDYHHWDRHEDVYYRQWEAEHHRQDRDFHRLDRDDQQAYWNWRHSHGDHDRDHDHDHDHDRH